MRRTVFSVFLAGLLLAGPALANGKATPTPKPTHANPAMWTVHGTKGTVFMLGSIHALPKNIDWQTPKLMAAIGRSDVFVFEVPMNADSRSKAAAYFRANAVLPGSVALPSLFDSEMRADFREVVTLSHADPTYIVYMRPWLAALVLEGAATGESGLHPAEGVDNKV